MIKPNCNLIVPSTLPISTHSLADYDNLAVLSCKVLDSVFISPSPEHEARYQGQDLLRDPVQGIVLGVGEDDVKLGVYTHPDLKLEQGQKPNELWRLHLQGEVEPGASAVETEAKTDSDMQVVDPAADRGFMFDLAG